MQSQAEMTWPPREMSGSNKLRINDVVFIETTQAVTVANGAGTSYTGDTANAGAPDGTSTRYSSIFLGDNAFGHAISLPVELRDGGILDFGREHALA